MDNKRDLISSIFLLAGHELRSEFTNYPKCIVDNNPHFYKIEGFFYFILILSIVIAFYGFTVISKNLFPLEVIFSTWDMHVLSAH